MIFFWNGSKVFSTSAEGASVWENAPLFVPGDYPAFREQVKKAEVVVSPDGSQVDFIIEVRNAAPLAAPAFVDSLTPSIRAKFRYNIVDGAWKINTDESYTTKYPSLGAYRNVGGVWQTIFELREQKVLGFPLLPFMESLRNRLRDEGFAAPAKSGCMWQ
jgi:hypothetical protein